MRVLLTGFEPFGPHGENPSWDAVAPLDGVQRPEYSLFALCLPVEWGRAAETVLDAVGRLRAEAVLMVGLAAGRPSVAVERRFVNVRRGRDSAGVDVRDAPVVPGGPDALTAELPVDAIVAALRAAGVPAAPSESAGTYVCNATAYAVLNRLGGRVPAGFLHVPASPGMAARAPASGGSSDAGIPSMAVELVRQGVLVAVQVVVRGEGR